MLRGNTKIIKMCKFEGRPTIRVKASDTEYIYKSIIYNISCIHIPHSLVTHTSHSHTHIYIYNYISQTSVLSLSAGDRQSNYSACYLMGRLAAVIGCHQM